jgi:hypothetical protein
MTEQHEPDTFYVKQGADDQWYWTRKAANNRIVSDGGQGYPDMHYTIGAAVREAGNNPARVVVKGALEDGKDLIIDVNPDAVSS